MVYLEWGRSSKLENRKYGWNESWKSGKRWKRKERNRTKLGSKIVIELRGIQQWGGDRRWVWGWGWGRRRWTRWAGRWKRIRVWDHKPIWWLGWIGWWRLPNFTDLRRTISKNLRVYAKAGQELWFELIDGQSYGCLGFLNASKVAEGKLKSDQAGIKYLRITKIWLKSNFWF